MAMHAVVMQRFPETPFVYGGSWSWFSARFRPAFDIVVYPYLPLVLIDKESVPGDLLSDIMKACALYAVPVVDVSEGDVGLMKALDRVGAMTGG